MCSSGDPSFVPTALVIPTDVAMALSSPQSTVAIRIWPANVLTLYQPMTANAVMTFVNSP